MEEFARSMDFRNAVIRPMSGNAKEARRSSNGLEIS